MKSYSERIIFSESAMALFHQATTLITSLPSTPTIDELRCHELARAVGAMLDLDVQDGHARAVEHSWLWVQNDQRSRVILDVYTPGRLPMVQLIDPFALLPEIRGYVAASEPRRDIDANKVEALLQWWEGMDTRIKLAHAASAATVWRRRRPA